jgi:hypothetical protein
MKADVRASVVKAPPALFKAVDPVNKRETETRSKALLSVA